MTNHREHADRDLLGWRRWRKWMLLAIPAWLVVMLAWYAPWPAWINDVHDQTILPVILELIYGHGAVLVTVTVVACGFMLLWPHRRAWPAMTVLLTASFVAWAFWYQMYRYCTVPTVIVGAVIIYVLARYGWRWLLAVAWPLRLWVIRSLRRHHERHVRCDLLYDAIRATSITGYGQASFWRRRGPGRPHDAWGRLFALVANSGSQTWSGVIRLATWRQIPRSLRLQWLAVLLDNERADLKRRMEDADAPSGEWLGWFKRLTDVSMARAEYLAFQPEQTEPGNPGLARAATICQDMSWASLIRQTWLLNVGAPADQLQAEWPVMEATRKEMTRRAAFLWNCYLGPGQAQNRPAGAAGNRPVLALTFRILSFLEVMRDRRAGPGHAGTLIQLTLDLRLLTQRKPEPWAGHALARAAIDLASDSIDYGWVQEVLALGWLEQRESALLEGHAFWRLARITSSDQTVVDACRRAACAFAAGGWRSELVALRAMVNGLGQAAPCAAAT